MLPQQSFSLFSASKRARHDSLQPITSCHAFAMQHFIYWASKGLSFMLRSWKCFASHGRAVAIWSDVSDPNMFQVVFAHYQLAWCFENLHLNHTLHNFLLRLILAPINTLRPQHGTPLDVSEDWQLLHPPRLSHLLFLLGLLKNPTMFWLGFHKYPLALIFSFLSSFSAPLKWAYAPHKLGMLWKR